MKAVRFVVGGGVPAEELLSFLRGPAMRRNLDGVPIWWCPWIHDIAVMVTASTHGLFALHAPSDQSRMSASVSKCLGRGAIEKHIRSVFVEGHNEFSKPMLPQCYMNTCSENDVDHWIEVQASQFPSARVLERRIAFLCATLTSRYMLGSALPGDMQDDIHYDNVPMFDHGGWPSCSLSDIGLGVNYGKSAGKPLNLSLLRRVEEDA